MRTWGCLFLVVILCGITAPSQAIPITISGSFLRENASVEDFFGPCCNPQLGFRISASGDIRYDYEFTFDAGLRIKGPASSSSSFVLEPGSTWTVVPYFKPLSAAFTATQEVQFNTGLFLSVDPPFLSRKEFSLNFPSGEKCYGGACLTLGGSRTLKSSASVADRFDARTGRRNPARASAWSASVDLITVASKVLPPPVNLIPLALDGIGMDLDLEAGLNILRTDYVNLALIDDALPSWDVTIPDNLQDGDVFDFQASFDLNYGVLASSDFLFEGYLGLDFDMYDFFGYGTDPVNLIDIPVGSGWRVGSVDSVIGNLSKSLTLSMKDYVVGSHIFDPSVLGNLIFGGNISRNQLSQFYNNPDFFAQQEAYWSGRRNLSLVTGLKDRKLNINLPAEVPEPSTPLMLVLGLACLPWFCMPCPSRKPVILLGEAA